MPVSLTNITPNTTFTNSLYADANLFCFARNRLSPKYNQARRILAALIIQGVNIFISNLVIDEMWWALLRVWHRNVTGTNLYPNDYRDNNSILNPYRNLIQRNTDKTLRLPNVSVLPVQQTTINVINEANNLFQTENLMPRDCFHLAFAVVSNASGFITSDNSFDNLLLPNYQLTVFKY